MSELKQKAETTTEAAIVGNTVLAAVPYQLCPKCNGQGQVSKPPYIAGDVHEWSSSSCIFLCDVCNGSKIIPMFIVSQDVVKAQQLTVCVYVQYAQIKLIINNKCLLAYCTYTLL